ncbi:MAG TPA: Rid family hydrolase [Nitrososphaeraceae archaeon]|nr:Rid family hydrolase [Nitrososphaeraceae archaeon]
MVLIHRHIIAINKESKSLGMPWEKEYGYSQTLNVGDTIYISGQVSQDDEGKIVKRDMETQMGHAYANIQKMLSVLYGIEIIQDLKNH